MLKSYYLAVERALAKHVGARWPAVKWQKDIVGFVREVLKERPLLHQRRILRAFAAHRRARVAVCSGHKVGKTKVEIWCALWAYCSFPDAQVIITATIADQIKSVVWRELKKTIRETRERNPDFDIEEPAENPATGLAAPDGRCIRGFKGREIESMAGISGENLFFLNDEASSLSEPIAQAITGNTAASARILFISNPTRTEGPFFDAFHTKKDFWKRYVLSSEDVAKYLDERHLTKRYPALASTETIQGWEREYGRDSPFFIVRALGQFLRNESGKAITLAAIEAAVAAWETTEASGELTIGIDPAGPGGDGDEYGFCITRGLKCLGLYMFRGLSEEAAIEHARGFVAQYRTGTEVPRINVDADGPIGSSLYGRLKGISETLRKSHPEKLYEVYAVRGSNYARRQPALYDRTREELWAAGAKWLARGGCFRGDHKLEQELHAPEWSTIISGKLKLTAKDELREKLGRSTDRADCFLLSVWEPAPWLAEDVEDHGERAGLVREAAMGRELSRRPMGLNPLALAGAITGDPYDLLGRSGG